jgi:hypothetical protein
MARIIVLCGKSRSGKDTAALFLKEYGFLRVAFADKLKEHCRSMYDLSSEQLHSNLKDEIDPRYNVTPRFMLQTLGEGHRQAYIDTWVSYAFNRTIVDLIAGGHDKFCITDCRYKSEIQFARKWAEINNHTVEVVQIVRPNFEALTGSNHISELDLDNYHDIDAKILNNGSHSEFKKSIITLV